MKRRPLALRSALAGACVLAMAAPAHAQDRLSLNGTWSFALAKGEHEAETLATGFARPDAPADPRFVPTPVPSNWAMQGFEPPHYKRFSGDASQGFYLRHITLPTAWAGRRMLLHFDGVWSSAEVWLNGKPLGRHDSGFTSFAYDVSSAMKPGADNVLAVRVRQVQPDYQMDANDDWSLGGIYRDVWLEGMPADRWLDRVDVTTRFDGAWRDADLSVRIMVGDASHTAIPAYLPGGGAPYRLRLTLSAPDGQIIATQDQEVPGHAHTGRETTMVMHVATPHHWTAETPALYTLRTDLIGPDGITHSRTRKVGFRQISTDGGILRVNGQAVKLRGVNRHDEHPDVGRATTPAIWAADIRAMKDANINFARMSHYPPAEGFLDLCDEMGLYVEDEVPMGYGGDRLDDPVNTAAVMLRTHETVMRDINHPSVIVWSIGNEDPLTALHMASVRTAKALDPTRPVLMPWRSENWLPAEIDIQAPHYFSARQLADLARNANRPIIASEYSHAYGTDGFGDFAARWAALRDAPHGAGGAIWMWADQGLRPKPGGPLTVVPDGWDGITDSDRKPTRDYWEAKAVYAQAFPTVERMSITPGAKDVTIPIRNDFDFTDLSTVTIVWTIFENGRSMAQGKTQVSAPPHGLGQLTLPLGALPLAKAGSVVFARLAFLRPDGSEITTRAVELDRPHPLPPLTPPLVTVRDGNAITVQDKASGLAYHFGGPGGVVMSVTRNGKPLVTDMRPALWRPVNQTEAVLWRKEVLAALPDLQNARADYAPPTLSQDHGAQVVSLHATYRVDGANSYDVDWHFGVSGRDRVTVSYRITPHVQAERLPFVGMTLNLSAPAKKVNWLGLGPIDAWPNEQTAPTLGLWSMPSGREGVKAARWVKMPLAQGGQLQIDGPEWIATHEGHAASIDILSSMAGRPTKFGPAEVEAQQLKTGEGVSFSGSFELSFRP